MHARMRRSTRLLHQAAVLCATMMPCVGLRELACRRAVLWCADGGRGRGGERGDRNGSDEASRLQDRLDHGVQCHGVPAWHDLGTERRAHLFLLVGAGTCLGKRHCRRCKENGEFGVEILGWALERIPGFLYFYEYFPFIIFHRHALFSSVLFSAAGQAGPERPARYNDGVGGFCGWEQDTSTPYHNWSTGLAWRPVYSGCATRCKEAEVRSQQPASPLGTSLKPLLAAPAPAHSGTHPPSTSPMGHQRPISAITHTHAV